MSIHIILCIFYPFLFAFSKAPIKPSSCILIEYASLLCIKTDNGHVDVTVFLLFVFVILDERRNEVNLEIVSGH